METNNGKPGGMLQGKSHDEGGIKAVVTDTNKSVELEVDEAILNKRSMNMDEKIVCEGTPKGVASAINELGGGVKFSSSGDCKVVKADGGPIKKDITINSNGDSPSESSSLHGKADGLADSRGPSCGCKNEFSDGGIACEECSKMEGGGSIKNLNKDTVLPFMEKDISKKQLGNVNRMWTGVIFKEDKRWNIVVEFIDHDDEFMHLKIYEENHQLVLGWMELQVIKNSVMDDQLTWIEIYPPRGIITIDQGHSYHLWRWKGMTVPDLNKYKDYGDEFKKGGAITNSRFTIPVKYKDSYELNKAIENLIDTKGDGLYTDEEKIFINQYTGSGGLANKGATGKGLLYEYYTPDPIVRKMWALAQKHGYIDGKILEPSAGIGRFLKYAGKDTGITAYEISKYSAAICKILYPNAQVTHAPFESMFFNGNVRKKPEAIPQDYALVIGNPPYGEFGGKYAGMGEQKAFGVTKYDHYFLLRSLDVLMPGGILCFIIPSAFLSNGSAYNKLKERIAEHADLVDAYRLPRDVFDTTEIGTDIIVFKKK